MADTDYMVINGDVVPSADARVHVGSPAVKYGIGVFEGIRGYWNDAEQQMYVFRLRDHLARLKQSMKILRLEDSYDLDSLENWVLAMIRANDYRTTVQMRVMVLLDDPSTGRPATGPVTAYVMANPCPPHPFMETGLSACTSSWSRPDDTALPVRVKCNANYVNGRLAELEARAGGYERAILLNGRGKVAEGPGATFFIIRNGQAITPSVTSDILESITRETLMQLLTEQLDVASVERDMDRTEIYAAEEAFLCGTFAEVSPIVSLDGLDIGDGTVGPITRKLQTAYADVVHGTVPDHVDWRTPVYV